MKKRPLGKTGLSVSEVAFGGVEIGMPYGIGVKSKDQMLSEKDAIRLLRDAVDGGINFFDTARLYGNSEQIMGKAFAGRRNNIVLATKCRHLQDGSGAIPSFAGLKQVIESSLQESLDALQTDYIDVFMLHQAGPGIIQHEHITDIFLQLKQQGRIRASGISTYTVSETAEAIDTGAWDVIQLPFNLMDQRQETCFAAALAAGVGIVVRSVLLKGILSNKGRQLHPALKAVEEHVVKYDALRADADLSTFATKFALSFAEVSSILIGIDKPEYLQASLQTANGHYLDAATLASARALHYPDPGFINLPAWDREGWLQ